MTTTLPNANDSTRMASAVSQRIHVEIEKRLKALSTEVMGDFLELVALLKNEKSELEKSEIAKTLTEIIFPQSIKKQISKDEELAEMAAARQRLDLYRQKVGEQIRLLRESLSMTQVQLAEISGLPQSHVSRLEQGKHAPTFATVEKLAAALGTTADQLDPGFPQE